MKAAFFVCAIALVALSGWTTHNAPTGPATVIGHVGSGHTFTAPPSFAVPPTNPGGAEVRAGPPGAFYVPPPPAQCDYEPSRRYTIEWVAPGSCGPMSMGCINFRKDGSCRIRIETWHPELHADAIRHEKGHCNCLWWRD
jgi:hypothetical protein